ncbi:MAG: glycosyltransferase family 4 protein [Verrucomicrobia bacterium]|nr:glycosyltransferase family 4 protein [Verrucomicrobiota bacterium]
MPSQDLRVLVIPPSYFAHNRTVGGGERFALEYARALAKRLPTTLALFDRTANRQTLGDLVIRTLPIRHFRQRWAFPLTRESWRALREFDLVHSFVFPTPLTDLLLLAARWRRQLFVLTDVGGGGPCWSTYLGKVHPRLDLNRLAHGLALLSRHSARFFADWRQPQTILYGGVNLDEFGAGDPEGYALFVGRLLPHKGVLPLIQALDPHTPLRVVGHPYDPAYFRQLQQAAAGKNVRFFTDADDAELRRQYAGANVVLQPTLPAADPAADKSELLGLVTLEAMSSGKPVIVTRTASLPELVLEGETGFVVAPGDPVALRQRVEAFLADPALSQRMGMAARRHVEQRFSWDQVVARGLELYQQLRRRPGAPPQPG